MSEKLAEEIQYQENQNNSDTIRKIRKYTATVAVRFGSDHSDSG